MIVGKQSVKNDLEALDQKIDSAFEEAKNINIDKVSQIETGNITSGNISDPRPTGVYRVQRTVEGLEAFGYSASSSTDALGLMFDMQHPYTSNHSVQILSDWSGEITLGVKLDKVLKTHRILTRTNTIVDSNGFIKTA